MTRNDRANICKIANSLRTKGYTLSVAFRLACRLYKNRATVKVAGVSKGNRQTAITHLERYTADSVQVTLTREKTNKFDSNAVAFYVSVQGSKAYKMGYLQASIAKLLSSVDNITTIKASLKAITGIFYDGMLKGLCLNLSI